jgi:hypothetical protein
VTDTPGEHAQAADPLERDKLPAERLDLFKRGRLGLGGRGRGRGRRYPRLVVWYGSHRSLGTRSLKTTCLRSPFRIGRWWDRDEPSAMVLGQVV